MLSNGKLCQHLTANLNPKLGDGPENYNWALSSSQENASINLSVNFFSFSSDAGYTKLYSDSEEKTFVFGTKPLDERPLE